MLQRVAVRLLKAKGSTVGAAAWRRISVSEWLPATAPGLSSSPGLSSPASAPLAWIDGLLAVGSLQLTGGRTRVSFCKVATSQNLTLLAAMFHTHTKSVLGKSYKIIKHCKHRLIDRTKPLAVQTIQLQGSFVLRGPGGFHPYPLS
ncbi:unnamed protein product [Lota lota]